MKLKRIDEYGKRGQLPVDMSDEFYNNGNEHCRYLITDYRSSIYSSTSEETKDTNLSCTK